MDRLWTPQWTAAEWAAYGPPRWTTGGPPAKDQTDHLLNRRLSECETAPKRTHVMRSLYPPRTSVSQLTGQLRHQRRGPVSQMRAKAHRRPHPRGRPSRSRAGGPFGAVAADDNVPWLGCGFVQPVRSGRSRFFLGQGPNPFRCGLPKSAVCHHAQLSRCNLHTTVVGRGAVGCPGGANGMPWFFGRRGTRVMLAVGFLSGHHAHPSYSLALRCASVSLVSSKK